MVTPFNQVNWKALLSTSFPVSKKTAPFPAFHQNLLPSSRDRDSTLKLMVSCITFTPSPNCLKKVLSLNASNIIRILNGYTLVYSSNKKVHDFKGPWTFSQGPNKVTVTIFPHPTHACTHARAHTRAYTHTHIYFLQQIRNKANQATGPFPTILSNKNLLSITFSGLLSKDFCMVGNIRSLKSECDIYRSRGAQLSYKEKGIRHPSLRGTELEQRALQNVKLDSDHPGK